MMKKILRTEAMTVHIYVDISCYVSAGADKLWVGPSPPVVIKITKTLLVPQPFERKRRNMWSAVLHCSHSRQALATVCHDIKTASEASS